MLLFNQEVGGSTFFLHDSFCMIGMSFTKKGEENEVM